MKRIFYILAFIFFGLFGVVNEGWSEISTLTFTKACGGSGTANDGAVWNITSDAAESTYDGTLGIHYGTNNAKVSYLNISTTQITGVISQVSVYASRGSNNANISVSVGGVDFRCNNQTSVALTTSNTLYTFIGESTGEIIVHLYKNSSTYKALYCKSIAVTYSSTPIPTTYDTITFIDIHNNKWTQKTTENNDTIFFHDTVPSEACRLNGWIFAGWSTDSLDETKIIKDSSYIIPTKNDTLYAFYKIISEEGDYITDTLTHDLIGISGTTYTNFNNVTSHSDAVYKGQSAGGNSAIQLRSGTSEHSTEHAGIITSKSGGLLHNISVEWNTNTATSSHRAILIYEKDTPFDSPNDMWKYSRDKDSIVYTRETTKRLKYGKHLGLRSSNGAIYLNKIIITWLIPKYDFSANPKCFSTPIIVSEWFEDSVKFDINGKDSTYNEPFAECDSIRMVVTNVNNDTCIRWFHVPIFAEGSMSVEPECDVVVLNGKTFTPQDGAHSKGVYVYPGGTLVINENVEYKVDSLVLRRDNNEVPYLSYNGTLDIKNGMFFEMRTDGEYWRWLTLPDTLRTEYFINPDEVIIKYYDGQIRADNGRGGWQEEWTTQTGKQYTRHFAPGQGVTFGIAIENTSEKRIYKYPLDTAILRHEKENDKSVKVYPYGNTSTPPNDLGWNVVGNPFMDGCLIGGDNVIRYGKLKRDTVDGAWTGGWSVVDSAKHVRYIVVKDYENGDPDDSYFRSIPLDIDGASLKPYTSFFIQVDTAVNAPDNTYLVFSKGGGEGTKAPARRVNELKNKETFLRVAVGNRKTGCFISDNFSDSYEIGNDMESTESIYQTINGYKLIYSAINDSILERGIKVTTPSGILRLEDKTEVGDFSEISALYEGTVYDLLHRDEVLVSGEFILYGRRKNNDVATGFDETKKIVSCKKVISDGILYIIRDNKVYNVLGETIR